jgi:hypothetical protein
MGGFMLKLLVLLLALGSIGDIYSVVAPVSSKLAIVLSERF